jgi:hypothetical protein
VKEGQKRVEKKKFENFHRTGGMCGELTGQPYAVRVRSRPASLLTRKILTPRGVRVRRKEGMDL